MLGRFGTELLVLENGLERLAVDRHAIGRHARGRHKGTAEFLRQHDQFEHLAVLWILQKIDRQRHVAELRVLLEPQLHNHVELLVFDPVEADGLVGLPGQAADSLDLALFHRQPHAAGVIAADDFEFGPEQGVENLRVHARAGAHAGRGDRDFPLGRVFQRLDRASDPGDADRLLLVRAADPLELARVVMGDRRIVERQDERRVLGRQDGGAVSGRGIVDEVRARHARRRRHVLDDEIRIAGEVSRHVASNQSRNGVITAAAAGTHIHGQGRGLEEILGRLAERHRGQHRQDGGDEGATGDAAEAFR